MHSGNVPSPAVHSAVRSAVGWYRPASKMESVRHLQQAMVLPILDTVIILEHSVAHGTARLALPPADLPPCNPM